MNKKIVLRLFEYDMEEGDLSKDITVSSTIELKQSDIDYLKEMNIDAGKEALSRALHQIFEEAILKYMADK